ncbi:MAG TPA: FAD-dependent oxidoreductase, partial [Anaeromyxobacteraceae bacterium]|nr:FAD-dependent oxidoreductase [Anaeromyxobacteraceae bacterium]
MYVPRTYSPWQRALPPAEVDVAVVGGGIMGAATAYGLRRLAPSLRVTLLEGETLAFGASGRNAGFLLPGTHPDYVSAVAAYGRERAHRLWRFTVENADLVRGLDGDAFELGFTGSLVVAGDEAEAERLRQSATLLAEAGEAARFLDGRET